MLKRRNLNKNANVAHNADKGDSTSVCVEKDTSDCDNCVDENNKLKACIIIDI